MPNFPPYTQTRVQKKEEKKKKKRIVMNGLQFSSLLREVHTNCNVGENKDEHLLTAGEPR